MGRLGYIEYNAMFSPGKSGRADSYARAIQILDEVLPYQDVVDLHGRSLYEISDIETIEELERIVKVEVAKLRNHEKSIFDHGHSNQLSYPLKYFCSAALRSLKSYAQYEHDVKAADVIVAQVHNAQQISKRLLTHFDLTREGTDVVSETKRRKGQAYFRRMILANYEGKCALTGMDVPQLLLASHIKPWADCKKERLNPCNGICLSALYDKAFDQGLMGFDSHYRVILSARITENEGKDYYDKYFAPIKSRELTMPAIYLPDTKFLEWHMDKVFQR